MRLDELTLRESSFMCGRCESTDVEILGWISLNDPGKGSTPDNPFDVPIKERWCNSCGNSPPSLKIRLDPCDVVEAVRSITPRWNSFHLTPCPQCKAPSWQEPCPFCSYYHCQYTELTERPISKESWVRRVEAGGELLGLLRQAQARCVDPLTFEMNAAVHDGNALFVFPSAAELWDHLRRGYLLMLNTEGDVRLKVQREFGMIGGPS